jgi:hypothetical protein
MDGAKKMDVNVQADVAGYSYTKFHPLQVTRAIATVHLGLTNPAKPGENKLTLNIDVHNVELW